MITNFLLTQDVNGGEVEISTRGKHIINLLPFAMQIGLHQIPPFNRLNGCI